MNKIKTTLAGTDLSREILNEVSGEQPGASFEVRIQNAINQGADLDWIRRHFHLSESELRDYCADIMDDEPDDTDRNSSSGY